MSHAVHTVVLSLAGLRRLRFQETAAGTRMAPEQRDRAELCARTALAALGLAGIVYQRRNGYDLRSRSLLVPMEPLVFEVLPQDGGEPARVTVDDPASLLRQAFEAAAAEGLPWELTPVSLTPTPKLAHLVRESRKLKAAGETEEVEVA
jgi:CRISPR-associated protein Csb1